MMDAFAARKARQGVTTVVSTDADRVVSLPVAAGYAPIDLSGKLLHGAQGIELRPVQAQALTAIVRHRGLLGAIGVGHGKTYIALLAGLALDADCAIVLAAPATVPTFQKVLADLRTRYRMPPTEVWSWSVLSQAQGFERLDAATKGKQNVVLVADEAHFARNPTAARTKRLLRWLESNPGAAFIALSGTLTTRRLADFAHLSHFALREYSPAPSDFTLEEWDRCLANEPRSAADLSNVRGLWHWHHGPQAMVPFIQKGKLHPLTHRGLVEAFGRRLACAPGVILTQDASCNASLYITHLSDGGPEIENLRKLAEQVARTYRDPAGIELADENEAARTAKRLAMGYYYQWAWPNDKVDTEWLDARQDWSRQCRRLIDKYGQTGFDTRALVEAEARKRRAAGSTEDWVLCWAKWDAVASRPEPSQKTTWVDDSALRFLVTLAKQQRPALLWYDEDAVAQRLRSMGVRVIAPGQPVPDEDATLAVSVRSHGAGLNLQRWSRNVFACVPSNGTTWEQVLGRTHRAGQQEDEVSAWVPHWTAVLRSAFWQAQRDAAWIEATTGNRQKLRMASVLEV
jgi:hypothetical protein